MLKYQLVKDYDDAFRVDAYMECGQYFYNIASIKDMNNECPLLVLPKPLGVNAVKEILKLIDEYKLCPI